ATDVQYLSLSATQDGDGQSEILMWDGRLDNRDDLRWILTNSYRPGTTDSELVLATFNRWGAEGLGRLIGDWSVVIYARNQQALLLASDYAGVRPLYYHHHEGRIRWSTRLETLVKGTNADLLDEDYVFGFLTLGGCPDRTPYAGIYSVPPGH